MVRFRMTRIKTEQFAILSDNPPQKELSLSLQVGFKHSAALHSIAVEASFNFDSEGKRFMLLTVQCEFVIAPEDWESRTADGKVTIPKDTLDYLLSQTVGTARGILYCKTEGTPFGVFILPPMNVSKIVRNDICIPLGDTAQQ